jgi:hypothetical protein
MLPERRSIIAVVAPLFLSSEKCRAEFSMRIAIAAFLMVFAGNCFAQSSGGVALQGVAGQRVPAARPLESQRPAVALLVHRHLPSQVPL